jgi:Leucine-rich repeat (LRR) protein
MKKILIILLFWTITSIGQEKEVVFNSIEKALLKPTEVKSLDLSDTKLKELSIDILKLTNLDKIDLGSNPDINLIQAFEVLKNIKTLKTIWITDCKLKTIPNNISELKGLEEIWLDDNELTEFPEPIKKLDNLKYLRLFSNEIKNLSFENNDLQNLIYIDLCYNKFETFPVELSKLKNIKRIIIWYNSINYIPSSINEFKEIEEINLEHNEISFLPKEFGELTTLKKLSLRKNKLKSKTLKPIWTLHNLTDLELESNNISKLSKSIKELQYLKRLSIGKNPLIKLPIELSELTNLEQLGLVEIPQLQWTEAFDIMSKISSLKRVGMPSNKFKIMPSGFEKLKQVELFWLNYNNFNKAEEEKIIRMLPNSKIEFN